MQIKIFAFFNQRRGHSNFVIHNFERVCHQRHWQWIWLVIFHFTHTFCFVEFYIQSQIHIQKCKKCANCNAFGACLLCCFCTAFNLVGCFTQKCWMERISSPCFDNGCQFCHRVFMDPLCCLQRQCWHNAKWQQKLSNFCLWQKTLPLFHTFLPIFFDDFKKFYISKMI